MEHKACQQLHANKRAMKRLGIQFNRHEAHRLISNGLLVFYGRKINNRRWAMIPEYGPDAWCLYDYKTKRIVTFLDQVPNPIKASIGNSQYSH